VCIETYAHKHKNTKFNKQNAKILGRVALLLCYLPSNRPPPLIRTSAADVNYTPPTTTAASYQHRGRGLHHAVDLPP